MLALVAAAVLTPVALARPAAAQQPVSSRAWSTTVSDALAIQARWHNVGYEQRAQPTAFPVGFGHRNGTITPVESITQTAPTLGTRPESRSFDWTPVMLGTALTAMLAFTLLAGGGLLRSRRRLASS